MSSANIDAMVREAKRAIREGRKAEAQALLLRATELDQSHEQAWMWLSAVVESIEDQMICLENVLQINPQNADARRGLDMLRKKAPPPVTKPPTQPNNPFLVEGDEWNIDGNTDFLMDALGTPSKSTTPNTPTSVRDLLTDDNQVDPINPPTDPFTVVFDTTDVFDAVYQDDFLDAPPTTDRLDTRAVTLKDDFDNVTSLDDHIFGDTALDDIDTFLTDDPVAPAPTQKQKVPTSKPQKTAQPVAMADDEDPSIYFQMIPQTIKPTRLPGLDEAYPPMLIPSIVALALLNVVALALLFVN